MTNQIIKMLGFGTIMCGHRESDFLVCFSLHDVLHVKLDQINATSNVDDGGLNSSGSRDRY